MSVVTGLSDLDDSLDLHVAVFHEECVFPLVPRRSAAPRWGGIISTYNTDAWWDDHGPQFARISGFVSCERVSWHPVSLN